jgi:hypothetical protein
MLKKILGPDVSVCIRDDRSERSAEIKDIAAKHDCYYMSDDVPLGHFAGDVQASIDALALAEVEGADIAVKMSQRTVLKDPDLRADIEARFENPETWAVIAGRPNPNKIKDGHKQYARFACLTDILFMRPSGISAETIKQEYERQVKNGKKYYDCFVELFWHRLATDRFPGRIQMIPSLTDHVGGKPRLYLRRYQNTPEDYQRLAEENGIASHLKEWDLRERVRMVRRYDPRPRI